MKRILLLFLLLPLCMQAQSKYLTQRDSILERATNTPGTFTLIAIQDSLDGKTDTLICEVYDEVIGWILTGISKSTSFDWGETKMIPGDGGKALYLVNYPTLVRTRVRRINVTDLQRRSRVHFNSLPLK